MSADRILDDDLAGFAGARFHLLGGGLLTLFRLDALPLLPGEYVIGKFTLGQLGSTSCEMHLR